LTKISSNRLNFFICFYKNYGSWTVLFQNLFPHYKFFEKCFNFLNGVLPISSHKARKYISALFGIQTHHPNVLAARNYTRLEPRGHRDSDVRTITEDDDPKVWFITSGSCYSRAQ
jgi:hypothetical protein